jgi:hypothetical protein
MDFGYEIPSLSELVSPLHWPVVRPDLGAAAARLTLPWSSELLASHGAWDGLGSPNTWAFRGAVNWAPFYTENTMVIPEKTRNFRFPPGHTRALQSAFRPPRRMHLSVQINFLQPSG